MCSQAIGANCAVFEPEQRGKRAACSRDYCIQRGPLRGIHLGQSVVNREADQFGAAVEIQATLCFCGAKDMIFAV